MTFKNILRIKEKKRLVFLLSARYSSLTLSDIVGHMSSLTKRYAIMGKSNTADVIRAVKQNMAVEHTA